MDRLVGEQMVSGSDESGGGFPPCGDAVPTAVASQYSTCCLFT